MTEVMEMPSLEETTVEQAFTDLENEPKFVLRAVLSLHCLEGSHIHADRRPGVFRAGLEVPAITLDFHTLLLCLLWLLLILRRQHTAKEIEKCFGAHRDQPGRMIAAVRHNPRLAAAVAFGLHAGIGEV